MTVRDHMSQHEAAEELPMITEGARVVAVETMDHNRHEEVHKATSRLLDRHDCGDWLAKAESANGKEINWDVLAECWENSDEPPELTETLLTLRARSERPYPSLLRIEFEEEETDIDFVPGQYVTVRYDGTPRPYSIASSPNDEYVEICVRRVPGGTLTPRLADTIEEGDEVVLRGPNGDFTLQEPSARDVVFLATGTGVAPFKSMIDYTFQEGRDEYEKGKRDVWLFLGAGWKDDLAYREAFQRLADECENFHFVPTVSREHCLTGWDGETAYVQQTLLKYVADDALEGADLPESAEAIANGSPAYDISARIDPDHAEVYACGTNAMVEGLTDTVSRIGVPNDCVESEGFG